MALAGSFLSLLDDITTVLDDVAVISKVAAKKTAGVLGDDLALNANQVSGVSANRELPVVWKVALGSLVNKAILVPVALLLSAFAPWAVFPLLLLGGIFLCFEGAEKVLHKVFARHEEHEHEKAVTQAFEDPSRDMVAFEAAAIKGAVRTDFILSAEIVIISLGAMTESPLMTRVIALTVIAIAMTVLVYGLVALIVKFDDAGLALQRTGKPLHQTLGAGILRAAPMLMRFLAVAGTIAMFTVGGHICSKAMPALYHELESWTGWGALAAMAVEGLVGVAAGLVAVGVFNVLSSAWRTVRRAPAA